MNKRQKIIVSITGIFIVLLALVGLTYAYFLTQIRGNEETKSISVTTANLILEYGDGNGVISLSNILPGDQSISMRPKDFIVTNRGNETVENYNVYLENVINQLELKDDFQYNMTCVQVKTTEYEAWLQSPDEELSDIAEKVEKCNGVKTFSTFPSVMSVIATNTINPGYTHYYVISLKYIDQDYDQSIDMNKTVSAKINIYDGKTKFLSTEIINNTLANKEIASTTGTVYTLPNELSTKIAEEISGENERILSYTFDDLGTSYYYRGNVNDNYVNFAGMCWRIVRIEGDGSVKLILEDQYTTCEDESYTGNFAIPISDGTSNTGYFGYTLYESGKISSSDGILNEGDRFIMDYLHGSTNITSSMANAFKTFQNTFTENELFKLKRGNWCLGDQAYSDDNNILNEQEIYDKKVKGEQIYYDSYERLSGENGYNPTLKCNGTIMNTFDDNGVNSTPMYVGTITADEAVYAGTSTNEGAEYYLVNDFFFSGDILYTLTLTPGLFNGITDRIYTLNVAGGLAPYMLKNSKLMRPMISIAPGVVSTTNSDTLTYGQPGTINNPYVIG